MIRLSINHINKFAPLQFPTIQSQVFIPDHKVPGSMLTEFYQRIVDCWLKEHPDRQQFGDFTKDIVDKIAIPDGAKVYGPNEEALGKTGLTEEAI